MTSNNATVFLTADHSNYQVWGEMYKKAYIKSKKLHIVVPHHGGNSDKAPIPKCINSGKAVIPVGINHYGHPTNAVINTYINAFSEVLRTDTEKMDIDIVMD